MLHEEYRDCSVQIFESKCDFIKWKVIEIFKYGSFSITHRKDIWKHCKDVLSGNLHGSYDSKLITSQVYQFNMLEECKDLYTALVLFHELRHHYQNKYNKLDRDDIEQDCYKFSWRMYDRYYPEIKEILSK